MYKLICIAIISIGLAGCMRQSEATKNTSNAEFKSEVLFTDENGYTVHRFFDGNYRYYVTPSGQTEFTTGGKVKTNHIIPTVGK